MGLSQTILTLGRFAQPGNILRANSSCNVRSTLRGGLARCLPWRGVLDKVQPAGIFQYLLPLPLSSRARVETAPPSSSGVDKAVQVLQYTLASLRIGHEALRPGEIIESQQNPRREIDFSSRMAGEKALLVRRPEARVQLPEGAPGQARGGKRPGRGWQRKGGFVIHFSDDVYLDDGISLREDMTG